MKYHLVNGGLRFGEFWLAERLRDCWGRSQGLLSASIRCKAYELNLAAATELGGRAVAAANFLGLDVLTALAKPGRMKDDQYWAILNCAVKLEVSKGHLRWTMAELARGSGVGRTLIYYYFGKSKDAIIQVALKLVTEEVFGLSSERLSLWKEGRGAESVMKSREMLARLPQLREFYFHWRIIPGDICEQFVKMEKRYLQKLKTAFPHLSGLEVEGLFALNFGLVMAPFVSVATIESSLQAFKPGD